MRIIFIQLIVPVICYFIGVAVGEKTENNKWKKIYPRCLEPLTEKEKAKITKGKWPEPVEISHVGYTPSQMGYDK